MHVLVPDDPVLASNFLLLENPLFFSLRYEYWTELTKPQQQTVGDAYASWGEVQQMLPLTFHAPVPEAPEAVAGEEGYLLEGTRGQRLTRLHAVDLGPRLGHLEECYLMLRRAQLDGWHDPLADVLREINEGIDYVDRYRRVLQVLCLPAPAELLPAIRRAAPLGPVTSLSLNSEQERQHRGLCERIIGILSADDRLAYATHRDLYAM